MSKHSNENSNLCQNSANETAPRVHKKATNKLMNINFLNFWNILQKPAEFSGFHVFFRITEIAFHESEAARPFL